MTDEALGTLVLVGTPIGNRGDLSPRARQAIEEADLLLCEDTRSPLRLLGSKGEDLPPRTSCFVGNEHDRLELLRGALQEGKVVVFVSEAGMPVWSDPGRLLVDAAWKLGATIDAIPGPTAAATALALSGFEAEGAVFVGFIDRSGKSRRSELQAISENLGASVIYEAGNRSHQFLADLCSVLGEAAQGRRIFIGRELTKAHQELMRGSVASLAESVSGPLRGEVCIVVEGIPTEDARGDRANDGDAALGRQVFELMLDETLKPRARAKALAKLTGYVAGEIYKRLQSD